MVVQLMLALLLVVFDLGRGFLAYISVANAARDGARVAMQDDVACTNAALSTTVTNAASPYSVTFTAAEAGGRCTVTVNHTYSPVLPFVSNRSGSNGSPDQDFGDFGSGELGRG